MAILNIQEFTERAEAQVHHCERCSSLLRESPLRVSDVIIYIFGEKRIIHRYTCPDCNFSCLINE